MKKIKVLGVLVAAALLVSSLAGCGCFMQAKKGEAPPPAAPAPAAPVAAAPAAPMVSLSDIHFDFDRYNIRPGDADILRKNADWFKSNSATKVRIEGNCDER